MHSELLHCRKMCSVARRYGGRVGSSQFNIPVSDREFPYNEQIKNSVTLGLNQVLEQADGFI